jgi:hypothetical protein
VQQEAQQVQNAAKIWQLVDARKEAYEALSDRVWETPEIAYTEYRSVAEHRAMLEQEKFRITENVAGIPTAVMGEAGEGGPVIAILGEYDALPGLSQIAGVQFPTNALDTRTNGIDLPANWRIFAGPGTLDLNGQFNNTDTEVLRVDELPAILQGT